MIVLYNILLVLLSPLWVPWMYLRSKRRAEPVDWGQRAGSYTVGPPGDKCRIWIHAVSVGECIAAEPVLKEIRAQEPEIEIVLSVTTSSGHATASTRLKGLYDHLIYFPIDVPRFVMAALIRIQPRVIAIMETEIWPNFLWMAKSLQFTTSIINGRISDRSYARIKWIKPMYRGALKSLDYAMMQSETDAERITDLGAKNVSSMGNTKFDQVGDPSEQGEIEARKEFGIAPDAFCIVVGSTRGEMEEDFVLSALADLDKTGVQIAIAPRHLERADQLEAEMIGRLGTCARRSRSETGQFLLVDTYGELDRLYGCADIAIVGGGFDRLGGQNLIQPLAWAKPVLHGPHMHNFRDAAEMAERVGATRVCGTPQELLAEIIELKKSPDKLASIGTAARELVASQRGASRRYAEKIIQLAKCGEKSGPERKD